MKIMADLALSFPRWLALLLTLVAFTTTGEAASFPARFRIPARELFDDPKQVALAAAAQSGDVKGIEKAIKAGADVKAVGKQQMPALACALYFEKKAAFARLLELGADPNVVSVSDEPVIAFCLHLDDLDYLKLALSHGGNPNASGPNKARPLLLRAVSHPKIEALDILLKAGADINIQGDGGGTAVDYASSVEHFDRVLYLLERGADPRLQSEGWGDLAGGLFFDSASRPDFRSDPPRQKIIKFLESKGFKFDWAVIAQYKVQNLDEATGQAVPMWRKDRNLSEPNPAWVKAYPEKAEAWYQAVMHRPAPKL